MRFFKYLWVKVSTILLNLFGDYRNTKLYRAVLANDYNQVKKSLESGADVRFAVSQDGYFVKPSTIIFDALCNADDIRIAEILYQYGARLVERNEQLKYVIFLNRFDAVNFLVKHGATLPEPMFNHADFYVQCQVDPRIVTLLQEKLGFKGECVNINYFRDIF